MHLPALDYVDSAKDSVNQLTASPFDPRSGMLVRNAKSFLQTAATYFVPNAETTAAFATVEAAIKTLGHSYELHDPEQFNQARRALLDCLDDLKTRLAKSEPSDLAKALGMA